MNSVVEEDDPWANYSGAGAGAAGVPAGSTPRPPTSLSGREGWSFSHGWPSTPSSPSSPSFLSPPADAGSATSCCTTPQPAAPDGTSDDRMEYARSAYRVATSKTAQRTLLNTLLAASASTVLFGFAAVAYVLFYRNYLPDQVTTVPVHLQYGYEAHPYGVASLADRNLKDLQEYDVTVTLRLPRSPPNLGRGNFMLALHLLEDARGRPAAGGADGAAALAARVAPGKAVLFSSSRPAIVPYTDPLVSLASRLLFLAYHVLFPAAETATLRVPMAERLQLRGGGGGGGGGVMPTALLLDVQAGQSLQVYSAAVTLTAQLRGLRWLMHTWRATSFVVLTTAFWLCEVGSMALAWVVLGAARGGGGGPPEGGGEAAGPGGGKAAVKREGGGRRGGAGGEDVPMTFPTSSRQPPLRYEPPAPAVKEEEEEEEEEGAQGPLAEMPPHGGEADDEDDDEEEEEEEEGGGRFRDSGVGTSYSDKDGGSVRRRPSRGPR